MAEVVDLDALRAKVASQGGLVRQLKKDGADGALVQAAVAELKALRAKLDTLSANEADVNKWTVRTSSLPFSNRPRVHAR
jgi:hypothetical protein